MADSETAKPDYARPANGAPTGGRGRRVFRPRLLPTLAAIVVIPIFISLGQWQWNKAAVKGSLQAELDARSQQPAVQLTGATSDAEALRYRKVTARGHYEPERQILIDNRTYNEQAGYHVVTPLRLEGTEARVLVNRGWIPAPARHADVPAVSTPPGTVEISGVAIVPGTRFFTLAPEPAAGGWQGVWQNLDLAGYRKAVAFPVLPVVIQLAPESPAGGFVREWPRPAERLEQHLSYALQWWGFAVATVLIWLFVNWRRA
ncbi:MAG: SURF1 family protein [Betaproteobacteria bacterium]